MAVKIYTAQYRYGGDDRYDITVKGGTSRAFAPTWKMVMDYKSGAITKEQYTELYLAQMTKSRSIYPGEWEALLNMDQATLVCFCRLGAFCHRYILANILTNLGAKYLGDR